MSFKMRDKIRPRLYEISLKHPNSKERLHIPIRAMNLADAISTIFEDLDVDYLIINEE